MNIQNLAARTRIVFTLISLLGLATLAAGVTLTIAMTRQALAAKDLHADGILALTYATPALLLAVAGLLTALAPLIFYPLVAMVAGREREQARRYEQVLGALESQNQALEQLREATSLSDAAKQIAYRAKDRETLRQAIREDIEKGDFEAANSLVDEMDHRFGYRHEAEELREQIDSGWKAAREREVAGLVEQIEGCLTRTDWTEAQRQCARLLRLFPDHADARRMPDRIQTAKDHHKRDLLKQWKDAIARDDVDKGVELLRQLDQYLTPSEAEAYKEAARDVFRKKLQQLGVQFALHVHDNNAPEACRIAKQIIEEFPNTRMAAELRERLPILEEKAHQPSPAI